MFEAQDTMNLAMSPGTNNYDGTFTKDTTPSTNTTYYNTAVNNPTSQIVFDGKNTTIFGKDKMTGVDGG